MAVLGEEREWGLRYLGVGRVCASDDKKVVAGGEDLLEFD